MLARRRVRRRVAGLTAAVLAVGVVPFVAAPSASAAPTDLFFSEYVEGSSNNKALEIYNGTGAPVDLASAGYAVRLYFNGSSTSSSTIALTGTVANGDVFVLAASAADPAVLTAADQTTGASLWNGDDAISLVKTDATAPLDVIGQIGFDPGTEWGTGLTSTADNTLRRKPAVQAGDSNGSDAFDPAAQWLGYPVDTFDGLGSHTIDSVPTPDAAPTVTSSVPTDGAAGVAVTADLTVTFSEPVVAATGAFSLTCSVSGAHPVTVTGGPTTFTLDPASDLALGDTCTLTVAAASVTDIDTDDPPDAMAADVVVRFDTLTTDPCTTAITTIPAIQGSAETVAVSGPVTTRGVVVGDYEGPSPALRGFYLQDAAGDGDPATSDGIFVFEGSNADAVKLGDVVTVTGNAGENQGQSQISLASPPTVCGTATVAPTDVTFPVASPTALERYEGMLVRLPQPMSVTEHYQLGRFGQVTLSQGGRLRQPTNVVNPGAPAAALQAENDLRKIILDDATQAQNPDPIPFARGSQPLSASNTLRGGDTASGLVGVLGYTWGGNAASPNAYRIRPVNALDGQVDFVAANPRPVDPPNVGGDLRVTGMNLLNFFTTLDTSGNNCRGGVSGAVLDCRGANTAIEFERQVAKTVAAASGTDADVVAFMEMENNGYGPGSAEQVLVDRLNAVDGTGTWAFIDADARTGQVDALGNDAIKVGMLYRPSAVTPVGATAALNTQAFVGGGDVDPRNRPSLAQAFRDNVTGGTFVAVANHLKSKGSACTVPDAGDGQANCNAVRVRAAQLLASWLATDPTATGDPDVLILGDLNSYAEEDPITTLEGAGFTNLIAARNGREAYSYVFDGQWGYLDHALGSASIRSQVTGVADWHINSDEPAVLDYNTEFKSAGQVASLYAPDEFRISDHDPVVVGLSLSNAAPVVGAVVVPGGPVSVGVPVTVSAPFTDGDRIDTHTAVVDWGDGTTSSGTVTEGSVGVAGSVSGSHTYRAAGFYTVKITVSDGFGHAGSNSSGRLVVYDRGAGQVVGAGSIASPKGAWVFQPSASGKGRFAFAVGYRASGDTPYGVFGYVLGGSPRNRLAVAATSYDYLVVTGTTGRFAGAAQVNGAAGFRYEVTAADVRRADTFRLVVRSSSGALVYDSTTAKVKGEIAIVP
ncbi:MAG: ExeM/NucH family extracellular endonuclease [Humibacillus sp.]|nr:ExeM/NucH family extracellular endonuclease [Humibacillus sp.]MDN5778702.1 ExeM/NucH family extracellular endonuclease [Humibacillus sp.]